MIVDSFASKRILAATLLKKTNGKFSKKVRISCSGIALEFLVSNHIQAKTIKSLFPFECGTQASEQVLIKVFCFEAARFGEGQWDQQVQADCFLEYIDGKEIALQRDFVGIDYGNNEIGIVINFELSDGLFNALRWFLPRKILPFGRLILHSSCVISENSQAYFFLGHSGAGKTTVASLSGKRRVLGDDMNLISFKDDGTIWAQTSFLGGKIIDKQLIGHEYPVAKFFWLQKDIRNGVSKIGTDEAGLKLIASMANLFWEHDNSVGQYVLDYAKKVVRGHPFYQLNFALDGEFWKYVEQ